MWKYFLHEFLLEPKENGGTCELSFVHNLDVIALIYITHSFKYSPLAYILVDLLERNANDYIINAKISFIFVITKLDIMRSNSRYFTKARSNYYLYNVWML